MERKGICRNVGVCEKANKIQVITDDDAEFVCSCGCELEPVNEKGTDSEEELKKKKQKKMISVLVITIILLAIIGGIIVMSGGSGEEVPKQEPVAVAPVDSDSIKAAQVAMEQKRVNDSLQAVADSLTALAAQNSKQQPTQATTPSIRPVAPATVSGSKDLGYATFKGSWPNDVNGRLIFNSAHVIDSRDPKGRVAEAGDYVIGEFSEGHLVQGIWYGADNQVKGSVIIGK